MFEWILTVEKFIKDTYEKTVNFWNLNSNFFSRFFLISILFGTLVLIIPILDTILAYSLRLLQIISQLIIFLFFGTIKLFKFIFRIKPKIFYYEKGNVKLIYHSDINGKLELIRQEITPIKSTLIISEIREIDDNTNIN